MKKRQRINSAVVFPFERVDLNGDKYSIVFSNDMLACTNSRNAVAIIRQLQKLLLKQYQTSPYKKLKENINPDNMKQFIESCMIDSFFYSYPEANLFEYRKYIYNFNYVDLFTCLSRVNRLGWFGIAEHQGLTNEELMNRHVACLAKAKSADNIMNSHTVCLAKA